MSNVSVRTVSQSVEAPVKQQVISVRNTSQTVEAFIQEIKVRQLTQRVVVNPTTKGVSVINSGPVGPPGPPGSNGAAIAYIHTQSVEASSWVINHNLGFRPNVTVEEAETGAIVWGAEIHHSNNQLELQFNVPRAGEARLS